MALQHSFALGAITGLCRASAAASYSASPASSSAADREDRLEGLRQLTQCFNMKLQMKNLDCEMLKVVF